MKKREHKCRRELERGMKYYGMSSVDTGEQVYSSAGGLKPNFTSI